MGKVKDAMLGYAHDVCDSARIEYGCDEAYFDHCGNRWVPLVDLAERAIEAIEENLGKHPIDLGWSPLDMADELWGWIDARVNPGHGPLDYFDHDRRNYWDSDEEGGAVSARPAV